MAWVYSEELKALTGNGWSDEPEPETGRIAIPEQTSPNSSPRGSAPVRLIILHTAEGARTVQELGNYFAASSVQVSSHVGIDDNGIEEYVPYDREAWTTRSANPISDNAELCGFAAWTRAQWLNEHMPMLENAAAWVAARCAARNVPIVKLTPAQVGSGHAGVCGHVDWTIGMKDGTHTDPGPGFPWDVVISLAQGGGAAVAQDVDAQVDEMHTQLLGVLPAWAGGITDANNTPYNLWQFVLRNNVTTNQTSLMVQRLLQNAATVRRLPQTDLDNIAATFQSVLAEGNDELGTVSFWKATAEQALTAFAASMLSLLGAGVVDVLSVPWTTDLRVAAGVAVVSVLKSLVASQVGTKGTPSFLKGNP